MEAVAGICMTTLPSIRLHYSDMVEAPIRSIIFKLLYWEDSPTEDRNASLRNEGYTQLQCKKNHKPQTWTCCNLTWQVTKSDGEVKHKMLYVDFPCIQDSLKPISVFKYLGESRLFSIIHEASNKLLVRVKGSTLKWCLLWPLVAFQTYISKYLESEDEPPVLLCGYNKADLWVEEHLQSR